MDITEIDPGCWVDDSWGHYGPAQAVSLMLLAGWQPDDDYLLELVAEAYLSHMGGVNPPQSYPTAAWLANASEVLAEASEQAAEWASGQVADGYWVGWDEGRFGCWPTDEQE